MDKPPLKSWKWLCKCNVVFDVLSSHLRSNCFDSAKEKENLNSKKRKEFTSEIGNQIIDMVMDVTFGSSRICLFITGAMDRNMKAIGKKINAKDLER